MTGTQCDKCNKIQTQDEDLRPTTSRSTWLKVYRRGKPGELDFCSKDCLIGYAKNNFQ